MRKREKQVMIRLSNKEYKDIIENAKKRNISTSKYLRDCIEKYEVTSLDYDCLTRHNEDFRALNNAFSKLLTQINMNGYIDKRLYNKYLDWLNDVIDDIKISLDIN